MTPAGRLKLWIVVVVAVLASPVWFAVGGARVDSAGLVGGWAIAAAAVWQSGWLVVMTRLMVTTPSDAIRLPARASWAVLLAGAIWFVLAAWWLGVPVLLVLVFGVFGGILSGLNEQARLGRAASPWPAALFLWSPSWWLLPVVLLEMRADGRFFWWFGLLVVMLVVAQYACVRVLRRAGTGQQGER